jgi:hypothetical protein
MFDSSRLVAALLSLVGVTLSACKGVPPTIYCVFESDVLAGGRCLTECESRCNLSNIAGCAKTSCVKDCEASSARSSSACLDASYSYWRCLRLSGQPRVTCSGETPVFSVEPGTCSAEHQTLLARCPPPDAGTVDAGQGSPDAAR